MLPLITKERLHQIHYDLAGKTVIVTGGTAGIGKSTAEYLLRQGCQVAIAGRRSNADDIAKELSVSKADIIKCTQQLENTGITGKILYPDNPSEYKLTLTKKGMALKPIFDEIKKWNAAYN